MAFDANMQMRTRKKKFHHLSLQSFLTLVAARLKYLKHKGSNSMCFYIIILKNFSIPCSIGSCNNDFLAFFVKKTVFFRSFRDWPYLWQKIWPIQSKKLVPLYNFTICYDIFSYTSYLFQVIAFLSVKIVMKTNGKTYFLVFF